MRLVAVVRQRAGQWAGQSNERAVANAREASTALSRLRVEREEVELYLTRRYAAPMPAALADVRVAGDPR